MTDVAGTLVIIALLAAAVPATFVGGFLLGWQCCNKAWMRPQSKDRLPIWRAS